MLRRPIAHSRTDRLTRDGRLNKNDDGDPQAAIVQNVGKPLAVAELTLASEQYSEAANTDHGCTEGSRKARR